MGWWADTAFDGIAGGVVGGVVTGVAVWATIWHEKGQRRKDEKAADLGELRRAVARLYERAGELSVITRGVPVRPPAKGVVVDLVVVESLMRKQDPASADEFGSHRGRLHKAIAPDAVQMTDRVREIAQQIEVSCMTWLDLGETLIGKWPDP